jgi:hypothetical protein
LRRERGRAVDDREGDRVERAHLQPRQIGGALAQLDLRALVEGDEGDRAGRQLPVAQEVPRPFGEHAGLAAARRRDDARRAAAVGDGGELVGRQIGCRGVVRAVGQERAVLEGDPVHDGRAVDRFTELDRAAVEPQGCATGRQDVGPAVRRGRRPAVDRGTEERPHGLRAAGIDAVGRRQVVQFFSGEREPRPEAVQCTPLGHLGQLVEAVDRHLHDEAPAGAPAGSQPFDGSRRVGDHPIVDDDAFGVHPRRGRGTARRDEEAAAEWVGPGEIDRRSPVGRGAR